jgi:hypothetical protein
MTGERTLDPQRVVRVTTMLEGDDGRDPEHSLCENSASVAHVSGAGVVLILHGRSLGTVCSSNDVAETVEEVQYTLGEGPCIDAFTSRRPVMEPDLAADDGVRWPGFREGALAAGSTPRSAFRSWWGRSASRTSRGASSWTGNRWAGEGSLARQLEHLPANRAVVHQTTGMVSVQAAVPIDDAATMLRAYAFATNRPVHDVATAVVARDLRFG